MRVGDKVRVERAATEQEAGDSTCWIPGMEYLVGFIGVVEHLDATDAEVTLENPRTKRRSKFWLPRQLLATITESKAVV